MSTPTTIPIGFIDVDGVLNSEHWIRTRPSKLEWSEQMNISPEEFTSNRLEWALRSIDPAAVRALNTIVTRTKMRPIISSSWRTMFRLNELERMFRWHGFEHHLLGATPESTCIRLERAPADYRPVQRGEEIARWLVAMFGDDAPRRANFVILDDDSDMADLSHRLYQTSFDVGLRDCDVDAVCALFEDPHAEARRLVVDENGRRER